MMKNSEKSMDKIIALCKNRGFVFAGSEIYGGLANSWDYGPLGVEFKNNVKKAWIKKFVQDVYKRQSVARRCAGTDSTSRTRGGKSHTVRRSQSHGRSRLGAPAPP